MMDRPTLTRKILARMNPGYAAKALTMGTLFTSGDYCNPGNGNP